MIGSKKKRCRLRRTQRLHAAQVGSVARPARYWAGPMVGTTDRSLLCSLQHACHRSMNAARWPTFAAGQRLALRRKHLLRDVLCFDSASEQPSCTMFVQLNGSMTR
jgi:hypothetical protein